jgi:hypothetical protein
MQRSRKQHRHPRKDLAVKSLHRHLLTAALLAALSAGAMAQPQTPPSTQSNAPAAAQGERGRTDPGRMEQFRARMQERMAKRMDRLKQKLQITGTQEGAWSTWTSALKPTPRQRPDRAEFARLSTPERIDRMRAMRTARNAEMDRRADATKNFYAALSPEQKKVFDQESLRFGRGHGKGEHGHGGHHRG